MNKKEALGLTLALTTGLLLAPTSAPAHDDGLTCHYHPGLVTPDLALSDVNTEAPTGTGKTLAVSLLGHALDNHVATDPDLYDPKQVVATHASIGYFEEMVGAVRRLVTRAERIADPAEADRAIQLAEDVLVRLPLGGYLVIDDFLERNRNLTTVVVPIETLLEYLRDVGTPSELVAALEESATGC